tara:strand:- start:158 stop:1120 length:963 start_codon:yes stop_codon:yes gene_type:complete
MKEVIDIPKNETEKKNQKNQTQENRVQETTSKVNERNILDKLIEYDNLVILIIVLVSICLLGYFSYKLYNKYVTINVDYTVFDTMGIYYINLDRSLDRRKNIEKMCMEHEIKATRFPAIDGKKLDLDDPKYEKALQKIKWWFLIENRKNVGHFGCYLSHMKIYETFLQTDKEYCLIFEDDAEFITPYLKRDIVHNMNNLPREWDILLLGYEVNGGPNGYREVREGNKDTKLKNGLLNLNYFTGLQGYIINRKCAKKLIENLQVMDWIIDWNMNYLARDGMLNIYGVYPPLVCQPAVHMIQINDIDYRYRCKTEFDTLTNK